AETARIWQGGCIIRSRLLIEFAEILKGDVNKNGLELSLLLSEQSKEVVKKSVGDFREMILEGVGNGIAVPVAAGSLADFEGLRQGREPANLIQGLRDFFG